MNQNSHLPNQTNPKPKRHKAPANFVEALKETSSNLARDTVTGLSQDLVGGIAKQTVDTLFNADSSTQAPQTENQPSQPPGLETFAAQAEQREMLVRQRERVKYQYETKQVEIYNQRQLEVNKKIEAIKLELQNLAREITNLDQSTQTAVLQEVAEPGTYHLNFFEKLLNFIKLLKKKVVESRHWANLHTQRNKAKSYYWKQANKKIGGTKFSLSQERAVVTQTG